MRRRRSPRPRPRSPAAAGRRAGTARAQPRRETESMVPQRRDELVLAHLRTALDPDLARLLQQVLLRPVLVGAGLAALAAGRAPAAGVRDPRRLLLALALAPQGLVLLVVLDA